MAVLPTNYLDDILAASMGGKRRFRITHEDGSTEEVTLEDVSEYEQVGSPFGSGDVNKTNQAVNEKLDSADVVDPALATVLGFAADAKLTGDALSELNKNSINAEVTSSLNGDANFNTLKNGIHFYNTWTGTSGTGQPPHSFGFLIAFTAVNGLKQQIAFSSNGEIHTRIFDASTSSWSAWNTNAIG